MEPALRQIEAALRPGWIPAPVQSVLLFIIAVALALIVHRLVSRALKRVAEAHDLFWRSLVSRLDPPLRLALIIAALWLASSVAPLTWREGAIVRHTLLLGLIALAAVGTRIALHIWLTLYRRRFKLDAEDNLLARKHVTQSNILERIAVTLIVIAATAAALMTFEGVAQYGISLLASAGAAGIVAGLALQPLLKNLFAGIQLAMTQPIRVDDALLIEGEWGNVEEITSTYVVVRVWDWRRLIVPLSYFIENPFQNWTREGAALIGAVILYLDHTVPVQKLREKAEECIKASPLWDGQVFALQVTDFKEFTIEVRVLMSARNAGRAFDLRCEVREKLIAFLQEQYPQSLPRLRTQLSELPTRSL